MNQRFLVPACLALCVIASPLLAAEPEVDPKDLPRIAATEPANVMGTFQVKKGFHLDLVASEPLLASPIACAFDENGRLFVVEMIDYSERRDEHLGKIVMLEDVDGDGRFDKKTVYAENLPWPTGVICYGGGILVASSPDIIWFKDTNGDGKADERKVVFTGFGKTATRLNVQALLNSFNWGMDNRIHGATAPNGASVTRPGVAGEAPLELHGRDFVIEPRTMTMTAESGGGQYGLSYDSKGRKFICSNSSHLRMITYQERYMARNKFFAPPPASLEIPVDGGAAEVYRLSPDEPWRIIRTKWRMSGVSKGVVEGGGRVSGYFTGATGATIYRGDAYPAEFRDNAFIGDAGGNLVHRKKIYPNGVVLKAERPADEQKAEFVASKDIWFRPVQFANAPDGCLYIMDMYREVIEHPWSLPETIKKHLDLNSGNDRGRIYRITPDGFKQPKPARLGMYTTPELVATLEHANGWHRDTASRLLYERQDKAAVPLVAKLLEQSKSALGRLHALHAIEGLGALTEKAVLTGMSDGDATVREHAVLLSEKLPPSDALRTKLVALAGDADANVRYQVAFTVGELKHADKIKALVEIVRRDAESTWVQAAVMSSLADGAGAMFAAVTGDAKISQSNGGQTFLRQLAQLIGAKNQPGEVAQVLAYVAGGNNPGMASVVRGLGDGLQRAGSSLAKADTEGRMKAVLAQAAKSATDAQGSEAGRVQSIQLLGLTSYKESGATLVGLLNQKEPRAVQVAAVGTLGQFTEAAVGTELIRRWSSLTPRVRSEALAALTARPERATALLNAVQAGTIRATDLSTAQVKFLQNHKNAAVKQLAAKVLASAGSSPRQPVIDSFMAALNLKGNATAGKAIYQERCVSCHRLDGQGFELGPDLVTVKTTGKEKMLVNILDPNREVAPQFMAYTVDTKDDESFIGTVANESTASVTVRQAFG
jgi:putative membrane-bound dehydrogenase-like protein